MKILGITGGSHSCGLAYTENGKPIFAFEEERFNRIRTYKDFYNNFFRYPYDSGQNTQRFKNFDWNQIDFITSFFDQSTVESMWYGIDLGPFPSEKFIKVDLGQPQFDALLHHFYYEGADAIENSYIIKLVNLGRWYDITDEIQTNIKRKNGKVDDRLAIIRIRTAKMWSYVPGFS